MGGGWASIGKGSRLSCGEGIICGEGIYPRPAAKPSQDLLAGYA